MSGGEVMVIVIVAMAMIAGVLKSVFRGPQHPVVFNNEQGKAETMRLREEVTQLKDRIKVLERIAVEKENSLEKQIEELRDR